MKAAWIGAFGAFGAIMGALIVVFGTPVYNNIINGPKEGVFSVEASCITARNIPDALSKQIQSYPCTYRIAHIDGPAIKDLSVKIKSDYEISGLTIKENNDASSPILSDNKKHFSISAEILRKQSVIEGEFLSSGSNIPTKEVVMSEGKLIDQLITKADERWYESNYFIMPMAGAVMIMFFFLAFIIFRKMVDHQLRSFDNNDIKAFAIIAAVSAIFFDTFAIIVILFMLVIILYKLSDIDSKIK